jgi:hypothetical protein
VCARIGLNARLRPPTGFPQTIDIEQFSKNDAVAHNLNVAVQPAAMDDRWFVQDGFPQQRG